MTRGDLPPHYPDWLKDFFLAPTDELPGFIGDWWDTGVSFTEDDDSLTVFSHEDIGKCCDKPTVTFYGTQYVRRLFFLQWMGVGSLYAVLISAVQRGAITSSDLQFAEIAIRVTWSEEWCSRVLGNTDAPTPEAANN